MQKKYKSLFILTILIVGFFFLLGPRVCSAALLDDVNCIKTGNCGLNDAMLLVVSVYKEILGLIGAVVLLMFVIGGTMLILSGGNTERVDKGKKIIIGSVIGMLIVLTSYIIISFTLGLMGYKKAEGWDSGTSIEAS